MTKHSEVYLAHLHASKGFHAARYPMHGQDLQIRRSILPHSEGGVSTSWRPRQGASILSIGDVLRANVRFTFSARGAFSPSVHSYACIRVS